MLGLSKDNLMWEFKIDIRRLSNSNIQNNNQPLGKVGEVNNFEYTPLSSEVGESNNSE